MKISFELSKCHATILGDDVELAVLQFDDTLALASLTWQGTTTDYPGYESPEEIAKWIADDPGYGFSVSQGNGIIATVRRIAYGDMLCIGVIDNYGVDPARVIAKAVAYDEGGVSLSLFDGDPDIEDMFELT